MVREGDRVDEVPVQHIELAVRHRVEVLQDDFDRVVVARRVDHRRAELVARKVLDAGAVDEGAAVDELRERLEPVERAVHGARLERDRRRADRQVVGLVRLERQRLVGRRNLDAHRRDGARGLAKRLARGGRVEQHDRAVPLEGVEQHFRLRARAGGGEREVGEVEDVGGAGAGLLLRLRPDGEAEGCGQRDEHRVGECEHGHLAFRCERRAVKALLASPRRRLRRHVFAPARAPRLERGAASGRGRERQGAPVPQRIARLPSVLPDARRGGVRPAGGRRVRVSRE